jgi:hypothetical protein
LKLDTWDICMSLKAITCTIQFLKYWCLILNHLISENCSLHSLDSACIDPNEVCSVQKNDNGVCKCKPGYSKRHPTESCIQTSPNPTVDSHSEDKPTMPESEYSSKVSGNVETCRLVHTCVWEMFCHHL